MIGSKGCHRGAKRGRTFGAADDHGVLVLILQPSAGPQPLSSTLYFASAVEIMRNRGEETPSAGPPVPPHKRLDSGAKSCFIICNSLCPAAPQTSLSTAPSCSPGGDGGGLDPSKSSIHRVPRQKLLRDPADQSSWMSLPHDSGVEPLKAGSCRDPISPRLGLSFRGFWTHFGKSTSSSSRRFSDLMLLDR